MKKMRMRKFFAMLLTLAMVLGMNVAAVSVEGSSNVEQDIKGTNSDKGTATVQSVSAGDEVKLYKIVSANYENDGYFSGYSVVKAYEYCFSDVDMDGATPALDSTDSINTIKFSANNLIEAAKVATTQKVSAKGTATGESITFGNLAPGSYLVIVTAGSGSNNVIYNPGVVSIYYTNESGSENGIAQGTLDMLTSDVAYMKKQNEPSLSKIISGSDLNDHGSTANIGDTVTYTIVVDILKYNGGVYPMFKIEDSLNGLTFEKTKSVKILDKDSDDMVEEITDKKGSLYRETLTPEVNAKNVEWNFVLETGYTLESYAGKRLEIVYTAKIDGDDDHINQNANVNTATLTYSRNPSVSNDVSSNEEKTYTYTFDIDGSVNGSENVTKWIITKTGEAEKTESFLSSGVLQGAEFTLYTDEDCQTVYENTGKGNDNEDESFEGKVTSDENGQLKIKGLAQGEYYLKETKAPDGYSLNEHIIKIKIEATVNEESGELTGWKIKIGDSETTTFTVDQGTKTVTSKSNGSADNTVSVSDNSNNEVAVHEVKNTKLSSLPSTGGIGTTIFTIVGCIIMIAAAALYFASRKKSSNEK